MTIRADPRPSVACSGGAAPSCTPDQEGSAWSADRHDQHLVLGGFAGIIVVWFWTPTSQKLTQPAFATLTSFGLAFLVGFSTDVFFQALDRLVTYLSQAVGTAAS